MHLELVASTQFHGAEAFSPDWRPDPEATDAESLIEAAGRLCYGSWKRPNPLTSRIRGYINNIRSQRHFSVFEHATASFLIEGISRDCTHQLVRHRHFSYSELSRRFVNSTNADFATHPTLVAEYGRSVNMDEDIYDAGKEAQGRYERILAQLTGWGYGVKQAREAARSVMPGMIETKIVVTGNLRTWRHFINVRGSEHADAEIRTVAVAVARKLSEVAPHVFDDLEFYQVEGLECVRLKTVENS